MGRGVCRAPGCARLEAGVECNPRRRLRRRKALASLAEFLPHFQHRSADVVQIDIGAIGITAALQLADAAFGYELPVTLSAVPGNIHAHLAGAMPYFMSLEVVDPVPPTTALLY